MTSRFRRAAALAVAALVAIAGCGGDDDSTSRATADTRDTPATTVADTSAHAGHDMAPGETMPAESAPAGSVAGGPGGAPRVGAQPDRAITGPQGRVGQFAVECAHSHSSNDDPIVHPGHEGMSHRHDFFGNTTTEAGSTYESLLAGDTTCDQQLDTASYWAPALLDSDGESVQPLSSFAYYRAGIGVDPGSVEAYPAGLMMVAGNSEATEPQATSVVAWSCSNGGGRSELPPDCADDVGLRLLVTFPDCWDGVNVDSEDHRSHVSYSSGGECSSGYPVAIPQLQFTIAYPPVADEGALALASGPIVSAHADFWNAWDQAKLERDVKVCLHLQKVCSLASYAGLGDFGDVAVEPTDP